MPAENLTITAQWTVNQYTIAYDLAGGTAEGNPDTYTIETGGFHPQESYQIRLYLHRLERHGA